MVPQKPNALTISSVQDSYGVEVENPTLPDVPNWEDELSDEYGNEPMPTPVPVPMPEEAKPEVKEPKQSMSATLILIAVLVVLCNLILLEVRHKTISNFLLPEKSVISSPSDSDESVPEPEVNLQQDELFDYKKAYQDLKSRVGELEKNGASKQELLEVQKKMTLLAIVSDENAMIARKNQGTRDFIYIDKDWHIDKMPSNISYDERTKKFLEERLTLRF